MKSFLCESIEFCWKIRAFVRRGSAECNDMVAAILCFLRSFEEKNFLGEVREHSSVADRPNVTSGHFDSRPARSLCGMIHTPKKSSVEEQKLQQRKKEETRIMEEQLKVYIHQREAVQGKLSRVKNAIQDIIVRIKTLRMCISFVVIWIRLTHATANLMTYRTRSMRCPSLMNEDLSMKRNTWISNICTTIWRYVSTCCWKERRSRLLCSHRSRKKLRPSTATCLPYKHHSRLWRVLWEMVLVQVNVHHDNESLPTRGTCD